MAMYDIDMYVCFVKLFNHVSDVSIRLTFVPHIMVVEAGNNAQCCLREQTYVK